jgi:hypothetical protein
MGIRRALPAVLFAILLLATILLTHSLPHYVRGHDLLQSTTAGPAPGRRTVAQQRTPSAESFAPVAQDLNSSRGQLLINASADTMVVEGHPNKNYGTDQRMTAGYDEYYDPHRRRMRSLVAFDLDNQTISARVNRATLRVRYIKSWDYPDTSRTITAYAITQNWSEDQAAWQNQPGYGGTAYGSLSLVHKAWGWYEIDVTGLVRAWIAGSKPNYGIMLRGPEESGADASWREFFTRESDYPPQLVIQLGESQTADLYLPVVANPAAKTIGSGGGQLEHMYGASISLPGSSIPEPLRFGIYVQDNPPHPLPDGMQQLGKAVHFEPSDIYFGVPAKLHLPLPDGTDLQDVHLLTYKRDRWRRLPAVPEDGYLEAGVSSLSWFVATIDPAPDEFQPKAFKFTNHTHQDIIVSIQSWAPRYPEQTWMNPVGTTLGLGEFDFWRSDQQCLIMPQGTYYFWVYSPERDMSCRIGPYQLGPYDRPWCHAGMPVAINTSWEGPNCWPGDPTGNVSGRPVLTTGSLQFILTWNEPWRDIPYPVDLDLHVEAPGSDYVWYMDPGPSSTGGALSVDVTCETFENNPLLRPAVENIFWPVGAALLGDYTIAVTYFESCGTGLRWVPYTLQIVDDTDSNAWISERKIELPFEDEKGLGIWGKPHTAIPGRSKQVYWITRKSPDDDDTPVIP